MKSALSLLALSALVTILPAVETLDPLVVTAGRSGDAQLDVPYTYDLIENDFISENTRRSLPEVLQFTPGVLVQKTTYGHGSPFIRGFTGRQNLLLIDGVRFNNSNIRSGPVQYWNTVDPLSLDRLELIKSQGSVLYGSDAIGGTLNAFTKSSNFRNEAPGEFFAHGSAFYEYRSNGDGSHTGRLESSIGKGGSYGILLGIGAKDFGDIKDSAVGLMRNTGYPEENFDLRLDAALSEDTTLTFLHQYVNQDDIWRWHSTIFNPGWTKGGNVAEPGTFKSRIYDQERSLTYLRLAGEPQTTSLTRWSATLSYQTTRDRESQDRSTDTRIDRRTQVAEVDTYGLDLSFESPFFNGKTVYGLDYYHDEIDSFGLRDRGAGLLPDPSFRPIADDSTYDLFGAYAQQTWDLGSKWQLTAGGRFTYARAELGKYFDQSTESDRSDTDSWTDFTGSLRALYHLDDCWSAYGGISQAFRAPNLDDLSGNLTSRSGDTSLGSVGLDPEEFITYELGIRRVGENSYLNAAVFYTDAEGTIQGVTTGPDTSTTVATNGQDSYIYGAELEGGWEFSPGWRLSGFAAWQDGQKTTPDFLNGPLVEEPVSRLMPLTGSVALRWTEPTRKYWIEGRILAAATADRLSSGDKRDTQRIPSGGTPSYVVYQLHGGWQPTENLELTAGLENIADTDYRLHGSGQNEPGFNAILGAKLSF